MSADNGIYILCTPIFKDNIDTGKKEYRVAEAGAIENITSINDDMSKYYQVILFGKSGIYTNENEAVNIAVKIYDNIMASSFPIVEYGIQKICLDEPFPNFSYNEAEKQLSILLDNMRKNR